MLFVGKVGAVGRGLFPWAPCLFTQGQVWKVARLPLCPHLPLGQASPEGQISHWDRSERSLRLLKVPAGQACVGAWGLEEPKGHTYLWQPRCRSLVSSRQSPSILGRLALCPPTCCVALAW